MTLPILEYSHENGCSVTGGYRYRGRSFAQLVGSYIFGDFCSGTIWGAKLVSEVWERVVLLETQLSISTFGEDQRGEIYVADLRSFFGGGAIDRLSTRP